MPRREATHKNPMINMIRGLSRMHHIPYREIADNAGISRSTVGSILAGFFGTTEENFAKMGAATLALVEGRTRAWPAAVRAEKEARLASEAKLKKITTFVRQIPEL